MSGFFVHLILKGILYLFKEGFSLCVVVFGCFGLEIGQNCLLRLCQILWYLDSDYNVLVTAIG